MKNRDEVPAVKPMAQWTVDDIPDLTGKIAVVTGANGGLGIAITKQLVKRGCKVIMACRDTSAGEVAKQEIIQGVDASPDMLIVKRIDMCDLLSVRAFAAEMAREYPHVSLLINNAGVLDLRFKMDSDGLEQTFKTNYLSHFLLTKLMHPLMLKDPAQQARVVNVSSTHHQYGVIDFNDLQGEHHHRGRQLYNNSKLMLLNFTMELSRRLKIANEPVLSVAAHPGFAATNVLTSTKGKATNCISLGFFKLVNRLMGQHPDVAVKSILYAATAPDVKGGEYFGPDGYMEYSGNVRPAYKSAVADDADVGIRLWVNSENYARERFYIDKYDTENELDYYPLQQKM